MITISNLNSITIDNALTGADIVTAAQWAFTNGQALALLDALTEYDNDRQGQVDQAATQAVVTAIESEVVLLRQERDALQSQLDALQAPSIDLPQVSIALTQSSFDEWLLPLMQQPQTMRSAFRLIAALEGGDIAGIRTAYHTLAAISPPSTAQLAEWQAALDGLGVPPEVMRFVD